MSNPSAEQVEDVVTDLETFIAGLPAIDHHCHGILRTEPRRAEFDEILSESGRPQPSGGDVFDAPTGVGVRSFCAPLLGLERNASGEDYLRRRAEIGNNEVNRILLDAAGVDTYVVDTGLRADEILTPVELATVTGAKSAEIVRLEAVAEALGRAGVGAAEFLAVYTNELVSQLSNAVGAKSIIAYRYGLDFDPARPAPGEVAKAADEWLRVSEAEGRFRLENAVLLRAILWAAVDIGKPIQMHVGIGDTDITMHRCDPTLMTAFIQATVDTGTKIMLLHNYPFIREAGWLTYVYPHVYFDTGAVLHFSGPSYLTHVRQAVELAPFSKLLFSTDAFGLPEFYFLGTHLQRRALARVFGEWIAAELISEADAHRYLGMIQAGNARRVYDLDAR